MTQRFAPTVAALFVLAAAPIGAAEIRSVSGPPTAVPGSPVTFQLGGLAGGVACTVRVTFTPQGGGAPATLDVPIGPNTAFPHSFAHTFGTADVFAVAAAGAPPPTGLRVIVPACAGRASTEIRIVAAPGGSSNVPAESSGDQPCPTGLIKVKTSSGSTQCVCPAGYAPGPNGACTMITPTPAPAPCPPGTIVVSGPGGRRLCLCEDGSLYQNGACDPASRFNGASCPVGMSVVQVAGGRRICLGPDSGGPAPCSAARIAAGDPACVLVACPTGYTRVANADGITCKAPGHQQPPVPCPQGMKWFDNGLEFGCRR